MSHTFAKVRSLFKLDLFQGTKVAATAAFKNRVRPQVMSLETLELPGQAGLGVLLTGAAVLGSDLAALSRAWPLADGSADGLACVTRPAAHPTISTSPSDPSILDRIFADTTLAPRAETVADSHGKSTNSLGTSWPSAVSANTGLVTMDVKAVALQQHGNGKEAGDAGPGASPNCLPDTAYAEVVGVGLDTRIVVDSEVGQGGPLTVIGNWQGQNHWTATTGYILASQVSRAVRFDVTASVKIPYYDQIIVPAGQAWKLTASVTEHPVDFVVYCRVASGFTVTAGTGTAYQFRGPATYQSQRII